MKSAKKRSDLKKLKAGGRPSHCCPIEVSLVLCIHLVPKQSDKNLLSSRNCG
jgi:hypothetical protein